MPLHDWKSVPAGIFHDFHNAWIYCIKHVLNHGLLPEGYYSISELYAGRYAPDVLTLHTGDTSEPETPARRGNGRTSLLSKPRRKPVAWTEMEFYRSKQKMLTVRSAENDDVVAILEIVSRGNKDHRGRFAEFVDKAAWFLDQKIHLSIVDLFPPTSRDPSGIHGAIWQTIADGDYALPPRKNRTAVSYECGLLVQAYVDHFSLGDKLPDLPLFLEYGGCVEVPLEKTYKQAFDEVPKRWRDKLVQ